MGKKLLKNIVLDTNADFHVPVAFIRNGDFVIGKKYNLWVAEADEYIDTNTPLNS